MNIKTPLAATLNRLSPALTATFSAALLASCAQFGLPKPEVGTAMPSVAEEAPAEPAPAAVQAEPSKPAPSTQPAPNPLYVWKGQGRWVSRIEINVDEQKARFYDGDQEIGWATIASGLRSYPTPTGKFAVQEKVEEKQSNLYGKIYDRNGRLIRAEAKADVDPVPPGGRFEGAKMPYFLRLTGDGIGLHAGAIPRPGSRASHGCIRMPKGFAPILFDHVKIGTPATIVGDGPAYATYLAQQQARSQARVARAPKPAAPADKGTPAAPTSTPDGSPAIAAAAVTNTEATSTAPADNTPATAPKAAAGESTTAVAKTDPATPPSKPAAESPAAAKGAPITAEKKTATETPVAAGPAASPAEPSKSPISAQAAAPATKATPPEAPKAPTSAGSATPATKDVPPVADKAPASIGAPAAKATPPEAPKAPTSAGSTTPATKDVPPVAEKAPASIGAPAAKVTPAAADKAPAAASPPAPATPTAPTPPVKPAASAPSAPAPAAPAAPPAAPAMAGEKGKEATG